MDASRYGFLVLSLAAGYIAMERLAVPLSKSCTPFAALSPSIPSFARQWCERPLKRLPKIMKFRQAYQRYCFEY